MAVWMLTSGASSIRRSAFVTPDSSTTTTVIGTDIAFASRTAASIMRRVAPSVSVGRIAIAGFASGIGVAPGYRGNYVPFPASMHQGVTQVQDFWPGNQ